MSVRYTYSDSFLPEMELRFVSDPLDEYQIQTRTKIPLTGLDIYFSTVEMNIAFKEFYLKSDKDLEDAKHLRMVYADSLREEEIVKIKKMIQQWRMS